MFVNTFRQEVLLEFSPEIPSEIPHSSGDLKSILSGVPPGALSEIPPRIPSGIPFEFLLIFLVVLLLRFLQE